MVIPQVLVENLKTKSAKIRTLDAAGFARTEIATFLGIRYQHVRNVLVSAGTIQPKGTASVRSSTQVPAPAALPEPWQMNRLLDAGFELLGECVSSVPATFAITAKAPNEAGVYAFAVNSRIVYVGLTRTGLRTRLGHYVYGHPKQRTSARIKGLILTALNEGDNVSVLIARIPQLEWNGLPVDGASGLETGLIKAARPRWNMQGVR